MPVFMKLARVAQDHVRIISYTECHQNSDSECLNYGYKFIYTSQKNCGFLSVTIFMKCV